MIEVILQSGTSYYWFYPIGHSYLNDFLSRGPRRESVHAKWRYPYLYNIVKIEIFSLSSIMIFRHNQMF